MSAVLTILIILLIASSFFFYRQHRRRRAVAAGAIRPNVAPGYRGLFGDVEPAGETSRPAEEDNRAALLDRAAKGEREALLAAHAAGDRTFYNETLDRLVEYHGADFQLLRELARFISSQNSLRANRRLALTLLEALDASADAGLAFEALHMAALADEASLFERAVDRLCALWRKGALGALSAADFLALVESEYWCLASEARRAGAGFLLKRRIVGLRRELAAAVSQA